jgi:hypothetical protein
MTRELIRRVSRLEDHLPPKAKGRFFIWKESYEDWESIMTRAHEQGYVEGDDVTATSWLPTEEQKRSHMGRCSSVGRQGPLDGTK